MASSPNTLSLAQLESLQTAPGGSLPLVQVALFDGPDLVCEAWLPSHLVPSDHTLQFQLSAADKEVLAQMQREGVEHLSIKTEVPAQSWDKVAGIAGEDIAEGEYVAIDVKTGLMTRTGKVAAPSTEPSLPELLHEAADAAAELGAAWKRLVTSLKGLAPKED